MTVKLRKWSPWSPPAMTRKFQVAVKPISLERFQEDDGQAQKSVVIKIKWKGEPNLFPLMTPFYRNSNQKNDFSNEKILKKGDKIIRWDEDQWYENVVRVSNHDQIFGVWKIDFNVLYGEKMDSKEKLAEIGRVSINLAEIACEMENYFVEKKLSLNLHINGVVTEATLMVLLKFGEISEKQDSRQITQPSLKKSIEHEKGRRRRAFSQDLNESDSLEAKNASFLTKSKSYAVSSTHHKLDLQKKKEGWFSWKRANTKEEKINEISQGCTNIKIDTTHEASTIGAWEEKELISRDGKTKLKAPVFFASFDQCSEKAAGESACTVLVSVISHWLHSNINSMPDCSQFDNLIIQGSFEWRKLCEDNVYQNDFPNKHFDLETIVRVGIRPLSILQDKSFVGFFGAEKFESLKGAMSFDDIWDNEISKCDEFEQRIYIVSWNDHFFVLKVDGNAYYIIDTLGERLHEGCNRAYILRFDDSAVMYKEKVNQTDDQSIRENDGEDEEKEEKMIICSGKECCREFMKRFLASIPLEELDDEEKKKAVSYFSLHQRLQIEFNYSCVSSSLTSSPFSSSATSRSSSSRIHG